MILGLGTIGIGRPWGFANAVVPPEDEARQALVAAVEAGYRYFDTAPSYGLSEERLGAFLRSAGNLRLTIATKFGEGWDVEKQEPFVDHSYDGLCRSLDRSMERLGRIDILQLHKTNPEVLRSDDLARAWEYASSLGISRFGASVSDIESAELAIGEPRYSLVQAPFNRENTKFGDILRRASEKGIAAIVNRPFGMGSMLHGERPALPEDAFEFILAQGFDGVILTGSKSPHHIRENLSAFEQAFTRYEEGTTNGNDSVR